jgi:hypothetical protein
MISYVIISVASKFLPQLCCVSFSHRIPEGTAAGSFYYVYLENMKNSSVNCSLNKGT